jgi:hypothetical protein
MSYVTLKEAKISGPSAQEISLKLVSLGLQVATTAVSGFDALGILGALTSFLRSQIATISGNAKLVTSASTLVEHVEFVV